MLDKTTAQLTYRGICLQVENSKLKKSLEEREKELEEVKQKLLVTSFKIFFVKRNLIFMS